MRTFELLTIVVMTAELTGTSMCLYHSGSFFFYLLWWYHHHIFAKWALI